MAKTIIGQNRDGSYIYGEATAQVPKTPVAPITNTSTGIPNVGTPRFDTLQYQKVIPGKEFTPVEKKEIKATQDKQKQVKDTLKLSQRIDNTSERTKQLREHFKYLQDKGELYLNDKQADYIKRVKEKYPDYENVPDTILYGKMILADEKLMEKYGNIGEKTFLQRAKDATLGNITETADAFAEGVQTYKDRMKPYEDNSIFNKPYVTVGGGTALQYGAESIFNVAGNLLNLVTPRDSRREGTTSTTELLGKNFSESLQLAEKGIDKLSKPGEGYTESQIKEIIDLYKKTPLYTDPETKSIADSIILGWSNLIGLGGGKKITGEMLNKTVQEVAERGATKFRGAVSQEAFDAGMNRGVGEGIMTGARTTNEWLKKLPEEKAITPQTPGAFEKLKNAAAEKIMAKQWKIRPNIRRDIRQKTGQSAEEFALSNNLVGKDVEESLARANAFKDVKMSEKADLISEWGTAPKTPAQDAMAASLKKNLEGSLSDVPGANDPELVALLKGVDDFINAKETTYQQIDALKSLYDHYNPDNLSWDAQGRLVNPTAHQNAAYRRSEVQKMIEAEGDKRGVDVKQINKDIRGSHDLSKGLAAAEERMANNNIISLGDTQIAIMGSLLGGDIAGVGTLAVKKMLGSESATSFLARKLYNIGNDKVNPLNLSGGTRPVNRVGRFVGDSSTSPDIPSEVATPKSVTPIASSEGKSLAISAENKTMDAKKLLDKFEQLTPEEKAKAKMASPRLTELVDVDTEIKDIQEFKGDFGYTPPEVIQGIGKKYLNYSQEAKEMVRKGLDKDDLATLQKMNREKAGLPEPVVEEKAKVTETKELPKKVTDLEEEIGMLDDNKGDRSSFVQKYDGADEYGTAGDAYDAVKDMDRFEFVDYASLWKDKDGGGMIPKNETASKIIDDIDGFADKLGISSDDAITLIRDGTGGSRYKENLANFKARYGVAPFQAKKKLAQFKKAWEAGKNPSIDDFLYKSEKTVDFSKPSKEEMAIENSKTPFDDDPVSPLAKKEPTTTETIEEVVTPVKDTPEVTDKQKVSPVKKTYEEYKVDQIKKYQKEMDSKIEASKKRVEAFEKDTNSPGSRAKWLEEDIKAEKSFFDTMTSDNWLKKQYEKYSKTRDAQIKEADFKKTIADRKTPKSESAKVGETELGNRKMFKKLEDTGGLYDFTGEQILIDGKEVGGIKANVKGDTLHIDNFFIKKELRGQGQGKKVIQDLFKIYNDDYKIPITKIEVSATQESKPFWEKIGGNVLGKQNPRLDGGEYKIVISNPQSKSSLPMAEGGDVKYSKPDLESEARKYKSAEEFINAIKGKEITVYRGTKEGSEYSGVGGQWHGAGKYYTDSKAEASLYGPSIKEYKVKLNKPFNMAGEEDIISVFGKTEGLSDQKIGNTTFGELSKNRAKIIKGISKDKMDIWDGNPGFKHVDFEYGGKTYSIKNATENELDRKNLQEIFSEKILRDKYNIERIPIRVNEAIEPNEFSKILKSKGFDSVIVPNSTLFNGYEYLIF